MSAMATESSAGKVVYLLKPRGFCAGVVRAIDIVELALRVYGPPIYVRHEIVHNRFVVQDLAGRGAIFVEDLDEVPTGERVIYSAHGVAPSVRMQAAERRLNVIDATCPLVTKVHLEAVRYATEDATILLIGHHDHEEVIGTMGEAPTCTTVISSREEARMVTVPNPKKVYYLTQTTLSLDEAGEIISVLKQRFPNIQGPPGQDICYATENRQQAVKRVASRCDVLLVIGSENSSNSRRLVEVGVNAGTVGYLVDNEGEIDPDWLRHATKVAITAGASAPELLVKRMLDRLAQMGFARVEELEMIEEDVKFPLPAELAPHAPLLTPISQA